MTQWYPPEAGTLVPQAMARSLVRRGHTVEVLTGFPNYPEGRLAPGWKLRSYLRDETTDEQLVVHRAPLWPNHDSNPVRRLGNYLSFAAGATSVALKHIPRPDVWLTYSSPATAAIPAMLARRGVRGPSALVIQDLWPDSVSGSGFLPGRSSAFVDRVLQPYCNLTYRHARGIGVISPSMADIIAQRGVPRRKIHQTPNPVDDAFLRTKHPSDLRGELCAGDARIFLYAGNLGPMQDLSPLVRAFENQERAHLLIVGDGVQRAQVELAASGLRNVTVRPPVSTTEVGRLISGADFQVVSLRDTPLLRATMPSKVQTSLASARPVLAHARGDAAELVLSTQAGVACAPGDLGATRRAIGALVDMSPDERWETGRRARAAYEESFTEAAAGRQLEAMLLSAISNEE